MPRETSLDVNSSRNVAPTTLQRPWRALLPAGLTYSGARPDANDYLHLLTNPTSSAAAGLIVTPVLEPHAALRLRHWHDGADNSEALWALLGLTEMWHPSDGRAVEWSADLLVEYSSQAGAGLVPAGSIMAPAGARYCDVLTVTGNYAPGTVELDMDAAEGAMNMRLEGVGFNRYLLVGTINGAGVDPTSIGAMIREQ